MKVLVTDGHAEADFLIASLLRKKHTIRVVNTDRAYCEYLAEVHGIQVLYGDASKTYILDEARIRGYDLVVALSENDATNLVICQMAKRIYSIQKAVAIVSNPKNVEIFKKLGVNTAISSAHLIVTSIERASNIENLTQSLSLANGSIVVSEILIDKYSPVRGKKLAELAFTEELNISCIVRGAENIIPKGNTMIEKDDVLIVVANSDKKMQVMEFLTGKKNRFGRA